MCWGPEREGEVLVWVGRRSGSEPSRGARRCTTTGVFLALDADPQVPPPAPFTRPPSFVSPRNDISPALAANDLPLSWHPSCESAWTPGRAPGVAWLDPSALVLTLTQDTHPSARSSARPASRARPLQQPPRPTRALAALSQSSLSLKLLAEASAACRSPSSSGRPGGLCRDGREGSRSVRRRP